MKICNDVNISPEISEYMKSEEYQNKLKKMADIYIEIANELNKLIKTYDDIAIVSMIKEAVITGLYINIQYEIKNSIEHYTGIINEQICKN